MAYIFATAPDHGALATLVRGSRGDIRVSTMLRERVKPAPGNGFLAGSFPDGITSIEGEPTPATVRVLYRPEPGAPGDGAVVAEVQSNQDGTWLVEGLNPELTYDVVGRKDGFNDVIMSRVSPALAIGLEFSGSFTTLDDQVEILLGTGPYQVDVVDGALPLGVEIQVAGDVLSLVGTPEEWGQFTFTLRVIDSNGLSGVFASELETFQTDPYWDSVVSLLHFDGDLTDETGRVWSQSGSPIIGGAGRFGGCITFSGNSSERVSSSHPAFGTEDWTVEMWVKFNSTGGQQNFFENLNSSGINPAGRFTIYQVGNTLRLFINSADRISTPTPIVSVWHHLSVSCESGIVRLFVNGEARGSWNSGGLNFDQTMTLFGAGFGTASLFGSIDELRITKGVARYTENFTPPTGPFPNVGP